MWNKIAMLFLITAASLLSFKIDWFNYILILILVLSLAFLILIGLISIFKKLKSKVFKVPLMIILICLIGILTSFFRPYNPPIIESEDPGKNLEYAYKTDQSDRKQIRSFIGFLSKIEERDSIRLDQVRNLYTQDKILKPIDKFYAAFIFHHSNKSRDYRIASQLASDAANSKNLKDNYTVQWLKKASYDRYMLSIGKPEKYNTQNKFSIDLN